MRRLRQILPTLCAVVALFGFGGQSFACPEDQYEQWGMCLPKWGGTGGDTVQHGVEELRGQTIGVGLASYFVASRNTAINGASPIPPGIRAALTGYSDEDAMNRVRYRIQDAGALNLAHIIQQWRLYDVTAVTLIDVIVFRGPTEANRPDLWAHELVHVAQLRDWGVDNFAISYARNPNSVEDPAYAAQYAYGTWASNHGSVQQTNFPAFPQPAVGSFATLR